MAEQTRSIVEEIRRGQYEASVIATFNAYFPFYEEVILPHLQNSGCRQNAVIMDGKVCGGLLNTGSLRPRLAGKQYYLIPITCNGSFHPKLLLLLGKKKGLLLVGSHNLTLAGFSHNRELTNRFEFVPAGDTNSLPAFQSAWKFIQSWSTKAPVQIQRTIEQIGAAAPWLWHDIAARESNPLLTVVPDGPSLWQQLQEHLPKEATRITVVAPFFDSDFSFLNELQSQYPRSEFIVGIDPESVVLKESARKALLNAQFVLAQKLGTAKGYLHAKALLIETEDGNEVLVSGSANASSRAWIDDATKNGNVEVVVVSKAQSKQSLAKALGFRQLLKSSPVSEDVWKAISQRPTPTEPEAGGHAAASAFVTDKGIQIFLSSSRIKLKPQVSLIGFDDSVLETIHADPTFQEQFHLNVPDKALLSKTSLIEMETETDNRLSAVVHHPMELAAYAQSDKERSLRNALESLETDAPLIEELMRVVEKVIFENDFSLSTSAGRVETKEKEPARTEKVQTDFSISLSDTRSQRRTAQRLLSSGDLGALLDALLHHLGIGLEASISPPLAIAKSEEELIDSEDEELVKIVAVDGARLIALCQRKIKTILRRMIRQLENVSTSDSLATRVLVQLAAVLGIVHRLYRVTSAEAIWIPRGETLVPFELRAQFFIEATRLLYATDGVMNRALAQLQSRAFQELSLIKGLLVWLAWDGEYDVEDPTGFEDPDDVAANICGLSRLLPLALDLYDDQEAVEKARSAIESSAREYNSSDYNLNWLEGFLTWAEDIHRLQGSTPTVTANDKEPEQGDIVFAGKPRRLFAVAEAFHGKVKLLDLDSKDELRAFSSKYVTVAKPA